jgi:UDP-N-acetylglucosamine 2-epimerase (non-hydrolysing)
LMKKERLYWISVVLKKMRKILIVFGTRPEAIKMAPVVKEFIKHRDVFETRVCVTAQHREMLDQVLDLFEIKPDYDLDIMKSGQDLFDITSNVLSGIKSVIEDFNPDMLIVHGDTTTTFTASLAAFYKKIKIAHVEAGLRTYNLDSPWPEEANRQLTGRLADYHFAPTESAAENLINEGRSRDCVFITGNTVIDALYRVLEKNRKESKEEDLVDLISNYGYKISERDIILVTGHRRENFGQGFLNICNAIKEISAKRPNIDIVYPVHLNPNVRKVVYDILSDSENIYLIEPLDYRPFTYLMSRSKFVLTDSGGIQEEAPSLGKPVLVMRDTTERPEAVKAGTVKLVGTDKDKIIEFAIKLLEDNAFYEKMSKAHNPYGDGKAVERIVAQIML